MYDIKWDKKAIEFLNSLEKNFKERIWDKIQKCRENPLRYMDRLEASEYYKLRIGNFKVIIFINQNDNFLQIVRIGHRKNVYK